MEKYLFDAKQAKDTTYTTGAAKFKNLIYRRIREAVLDGYTSIVHYFSETYTVGEDNTVVVTIPPDIVSELQTELRQKGYSVEIVYNIDNDNAIIVDWSK